jgi:hypothetical protein
MSTAQILEIIFDNLMVWECEEVNILYESGLPISACTFHLHISLIS